MKLSKINDLRKGRGRVFGVDHLGSLGTGMIGRSGA